MKNLFLTCFVGIFTFIGSASAQVDISSTNSSFSNFIITSDTVQSDSIFGFNDFSFGSSLGSWSAENLEASSKNNKDIAFSNFIGVELSNALTNAQIYSFVNVDLPQFLKDQTLSIYTFFPDTSNIDSVSLFIKFDDPDDSSEGMTKVTYSIDPYVSDCLYAVSML